MSTKPVSVAEVEAFVDRMLKEQGPHFVKGYLKGIMVFHMTHDHLRVHFEDYEKNYAQKETV